MKNLGNYLLNLNKCFVIFWSFDNSLLASLPFALILLTKPLLIVRKGKSYMDLNLAILLISLPSAPLFCFAFDRGCPENQVSWFSWKSTNLDWEDVRGLRCNVTRWNLRVGSQKCALTCQAFVGKQSMHQKLWRTYSMPINLDKESSSPFSQDYSSDNENASEDSPEELLDQPLGSDEVKFY